VRGKKYIGYVAGTDIRQCKPSLLTLLHYMTGHYYERAVLAEQESTLISENAALRKIKNSS
jgi:hypothetical protein